LKKQVLTTWGLVIVMLSSLVLSSKTTLANSDQPIEDKLLTNVSAIAAGSTSGYSIKKDGTAWAWGGGVPLGNGTNTSSSTPVKMKIDHVKQIASGKLWIKNLN
jgi:alpha-tubulin suppressor-like RCC1 family protein